MKHCRIEVRVSFLAFLCVYYYIDPLGSFFPFVIAAAFHELSHILLLKILHIRIHSLNLTAFGTVLETSPLPYRTELVVSLAGPCANLLLLLFSAKHFALFALVNLCLFLYNMLPIPPLDGGRALAALLYIMLPERLAKMLQMLISTLCLLSILLASIYLTCVWHAGLWPVMLGAMLLFRILETNLPSHRNTS